MQKRRLINERARISSIEERRASQAQRREAIRAMASTSEYTLEEIAEAFGIGISQVKSVAIGLPWKKKGRMFTPMANAADDFEAVITPDFRPVDAPPGSLEKVEVLARRVSLGLPLWHVEDRVDYAGLTGSGLYRSSSGSEPGIREVSVSKFEEWLAE